jgi:hypothetical protein
MVPMLRRRARRLEAPPQSLDENEKLNELMRLVGSPGALRSQESPLQSRTSPSTYNHQESPSRRPPPSGSRRISPTSSESTPTTSRSWSHTSPAKNVRLPQIQVESPSTAHKSFDYERTNVSVVLEKEFVDSGPFGRSELKSDRPSLYEQLQRRIIAKPVQNKHFLNTSTESAVSSTVLKDEGFFRRLKENLFRMSNSESKRKKSVRRRSAAHEGGDPVPSTTQGLNQLSNHGIHGTKIEVAPRKPSIRRRSSTVHSARASINDPQDPAEHQEHVAPPKSTWPYSARSRFQGAFLRFSPGRLRPAHTPHAFKPRAAPRAARRLQAARRPARRAPPSSSDSHIEKLETAVRIR